MTTGRFKKHHFKVVGEVLGDSVLRSLTFIFGFAIGTVIDMGFFTLYKIWDPEEKSIWKLTPLVLAQIYVLMLMLVSISRYKQTKHIHGSISNLGLIVAQIFMLEYAVARYGDLIYNRPGKTKRQKSWELVETWLNNKQ